LFDHSGFESQKAFQPKLLIVLFYVLFVCESVLYYCHWVSTQLQLTNISITSAVFLPYGGRQSSTPIQNLWLHYNVVYFSLYSFRWRMWLKTDELNGTSSTQFLSALNFSIKNITNYYCHIQVYELTFISKSFIIYEYLFLLLSWHWKFMLWYCGIWHSVVW